MTVSTTELLCHLPPFEGLRPADLDRLHAIVEVENYGPGDIVVDHGANDHKCFVIASGAADVVVDEHVIATLVPGQFVGEIGLVDDDVQAASVVAATPVTVCVVDCEQFAQLLETHPGVARRVVAELDRSLLAVDQPLAAHKP